MGYVHARVFAVAWSSIRAFFLRLSLRPATGISPYSGADGSAAEQALLTAHPLVQAAVLVPGQ